MRLLGQMRKSGRSFFRASPTCCSPCGCVDMRVSALSGHRAKRFLTLKHLWHQLSLGLWKRRDCVCVCVCVNSVSQEHSRACLLFVFLSSHSALIRKRQIPSSKIVVEAVFLFCKFSSTFTCFHSTTVEFYQ